MLARVSDRRAGREIKQLEALSQEPRGEDFPPYFAVDPPLDIECAFCSRSESKMHSQRAGALRDRSSLSLDAAVRGPRENGEEPSGMPAPLRPPRQSPRCYLLPH